ncbi:MAG TPA: acyl-CoA synthetase [Aliidongia sp.]|nr:acyl-CoA synthetase [Aliidongia sp.]
MGWNLGDILDAIAPVLPDDAPALIHGERRASWAEMTRRSNNLGRALFERGIEPGDHVAFYMRNRPEYVETLAAALKARLVHVNVNYRYQPHEVHYILDNSDAGVVVYDREFRPVIEAIRVRLDKVRLFVEIGEDTASFAEPYEALAMEGDGAPLGIERSPDDILMVYTGGTTGMPKGVVWRHDDLRESQLAGERLKGPVAETVPALAEAIRQAGPGSKLIPASPLMHGAALYIGTTTLLAGGCIVTLEGPSFDAEELWSVVDRHRVDSLAIVGDAFARPMLRALEENPGRWDPSSVRLMISSGAMWSAEIKRGLLRYMPAAALFDTFSASEGIGFGSSTMTAAGQVQTAKFTLGTRCKVIDEAGKPVAPGSGRPGMVALGSPVPLGYYKDPAKTAETFRMIDGVRHSVPGDWCLVEADGSLTLLGRGSACINTAGEKVYPEEVEEVLKTHASVDDALVVGVPDEKWGHAVVGVVALAAGAGFDEASVREHVRGRLAGFKTPKRILVSEVKLRAPNGKADYKAVREFAAGRLTGSA